MDANKLRNGHKVLIENEPFLVVKYMLRPQSRGSAKMITKLKNLITGAVIEKTFMSGENLEEADISKNSAQYLYQDGDNFVFMDNLTYEQFEFSRDKLGDIVNFLKDDMEVDLMKFNGNPINVDLPPNISLEVTETEPGLKGDTASGGTKNAVLETGVNLQVPLFIKKGDKIIVNTMTGEYKERA
jgi:elongation factor P